jgi:hypothetical protein
MNGDLYSGRYSTDEIRRIMDVGCKPHGLMKPFTAFYKKAPGEFGPSWVEKRDVWFTFNTFIDLSLLTVCPLADI